MTPSFFYINTSMATTALDRQPDKLDYASPTQFRFVINQLPKVEFFTVAANVPSINLGEAVFPTPFRQIPIAGDELTYDNFSVTFIVDEFLENYITLHDWLVGHGFPTTRQEFKTFRDETSVTEIKTERAGQSGGRVTGDRPMTSDCTMTILSNKNNPIVEVRFRDMYPVSLGELSYDQGATDVDYIRVDASFSYQSFTIHTLR